MFWMDRVVLTCPVTLDIFGINPLDSRLTEKTFKQLKKVIALLKQDDFDPANTDPDLHKRAPDLIIYR